MEEVNQNFWRKCGSCKKEIGFNDIYQVCNVSSCRKLVFCSVDCWDLHNPVMNHKSSWAEEQRSPSKEAFFSKDHQEPNRPKRILITGDKPSAIDSILNGGERSNLSDEEILIVVSKLKLFVKDNFNMNTAASVAEILSHQVRRLVRDAAENARKDGRKTIMDRDFL